MKPRDAGNTQSDSAVFDAGLTPECLVHSDCLDSEHCHEHECIDCLPGPDCNQNRFPDQCDLIRGRSQDCNTNRIPDECDLADNRSFDCNQNRVLDECELIDDGCTLFGRNDYIEYVAGNIPIIVGAPHGGTLRPAEIPERQGGTQVRDTNTTELARAFSEQMQNHLGGRPHLILVHLHRSRFDANRALAEATEGHPFAVQAHVEYHRYIEAAKRSAVQQYGRGLYFDFHGLNASRDKIELGYLLSSAQLEIADERLQHPGYANFSSIRTLAQQSPARFDQLLRGTNSLGSLLSAQGFATVPSAEFPDPGRDAAGDRNRYFRGGYNTVRHGSIFGGPISAIQIEHTYSGVRDSASNRRAYSLALAESVDRFFIAHFEFNLRARSRIGIQAKFVDVFENGSAVTIPIHRHGDLADRIEVPLRYAGTATLSEDVLELPRQIVFEAGQSQSNLVLVPRDDSELEGPDTIEIFIETSTRFSRMDSGSHAPDATIIIHDDEQPSISISATTTLLFEASDHAVITLSCLPPQSPLAVELESVGTATPEIDFAFGPGKTWTNDVLHLDIANDDATVQVRLDTIDDDEEEGLETIELSVRNTNVYAMSPKPTTRILIQDDDLDSALIQWWPGRAENGAFHNLVHRGDRPIILPDRFSGPQHINGPKPNTTALRFDGVDDIIMSPDLETSGSNTFTLIFWFRVAANPTNSYGYFYSHSQAGSSEYLHVYISQTGTIRTAIRGSDDGNDYDALDVRNSLILDSWHHYALTVSTSSTGTQSTVFLDGVPRSRAARGGPGFNPAGFVSIGGRWDLSAIRHFAGDMSGIRIYSRGLSAAEIQNLSR